MSFSRGGDVYVQDNACRVTLTRGQRGGYGWEVRFEGNEPENVLREINAADRKLREQYGTEVKENGVQ